MLFAPHRARPGHRAVSIRMDCVLFFLPLTSNWNYVTLSTFAMLGEHRTTFWACCSCLSPAPEVHCPYGHNSNQYQVWEDLFSLSNVLCLQVLQASQYIFYLLPFNSFKVFRKNLFLKTSIEFSLSSQNESLIYLIVLSIWFHIFFVNFIMCIKSLRNLKLIECFRPRSFNWSNTKSLRLPDIPYLKQQISMLKLNFQNAPASFCLDIQTI